MTSFEETIAPLKQSTAHFSEVSVSDTSQQYGSPQETKLPLLVVKSSLCEAVICLQGAHLLEFQPVGKAALLWISPQVIFKPGVAIRGGVPVCLPWFAVNQEDPSKPKHGFARNRLWTLKQAGLQNDGNCRLVFGFSSNDDTLTLYPFRFRTELEMILGDKASLSLSVYNEDPQPIPVSWALHSYHPVHSLEHTRVLGLEDHRYLDNTEGLTPKTQSGAVEFTGEVDRAYENVETSQIIEGDPRIRIRGENCPTAIVWNPGKDNAAKMGDVGAGNHESFICVERGAAFANRWMIPSDDHQTGTLIMELT